MDGFLKNNNLSKAEIRYYGRHLTLEEIGLNGQKKLKSARVLVVGAGGLGIPVLQYLTAAGVGQIGIIDFDQVEIHNLHRQILFDTSDVGRLKAEVAKTRLEKLNPYIRIDAIHEKLTSDNSLEIFGNYDVIVDCTDNFPARYLINDTCLMLNLPFIYGSIYKFEGQLSVFNFVDDDGRRGPNYRDLYPEPPPVGLVPNCAEAGVLGVLPGIIGCLQANEAIKLITGTGSILNSKLLLFDALSLDTQVIKIPHIRNKKHAVPKKLIDYDAFCGHGPQHSSTTDVMDIAEISYEEAIKLKDQNSPIQWIDVREPHEHQVANLGGLLIPLRELPLRVDEINRENKVIIYCQSGRRSADAIRYLEKEHNRTNLYNLKGGMVQVLQNP
ncbi:MAG: molybdopterin-synthase adenylyltransferase MoeB [Balneolales bacterium]